MIKLMPGNGTENRRLAAILFGDNAAFSTLELLELPRSVPRRGFSRR